MPSLPFPSHWASGSKTKKAQESKVIYLAGKVEVDCACVCWYIALVSQKGGEKKTVMKMKYVGADGDGGLWDVGRGILHRVNFFKQKKKPFLHLRKKKERDPFVHYYPQRLTGTKKEKKGVKNVRVRVCKSGSGGPQSERKTFF
jgi:hypothetical protein